MFALRLFRAFPSTARTTCRTFSSSTSSTSTTFRQSYHQHTFFQQSFQRPRQRVNWQQSWTRAQKRNYRRQAFNYQRFQNTQGYLKAWAARPTFYYEVGGIGVLCGGIYIYNLESVPVSGRRRFNIISQESESAMGKQMYQQTLQEYRNQILPAYTKEHRMVQRVLDRLVPQSGLEGEAWEIFVIDDDMKNAFVIPGGKVFVFRGILDICQDDNGLAAVLGHEIAHNVAHHAAERMSRSLFVWPVIALGILFGIDVGLSQLALNLAFNLPGSRSQEEEADYIGLQMMAKSCYQPQAAAGLWSRMQEEEKGAPLQFLSTHPSSHNRLRKIQGWLPEAEVKYESSDCHALGGYVSDFKSVADFNRW